MHNLQTQMRDHLWNLVLSCGPKETLLCQTLISQLTKQPTQQWNQWYETQGQSRISFIVHTTLRTEFPGGSFSLKPLIFSVCCFGLL